MSTIVEYDTPGAVEAMAKIIGLEVMDDDGWPTHPSTREVVEAAAMLRRLHQRAVDAERERDELQGQPVQDQVG